MLIIFIYEISRSIQFPFIILNIFIGSRLMGIPKTCYFPMTRSIRLSVLTGFQPRPINLSEFFQARNTKSNLCSILYLSHALVRYPFGHASPSNEDVLECWSLWSLSSLYRFTYRSKTTYIYIIYCMFSNDHTIKGSRLIRGH